MVAIKVYEQVTARKAEAVDSSGTSFIGGKSLWTSLCCSIRLQVTF